MLDEYEVLGVLCGGAVVLLTFGIFMYAFLILIKHCFERSGYKYRFAECPWIYEPSTEIDYIDADAVFDI